MGRRPSVDPLDPDERFTRWYFLIAVLILVASLVNLLMTADDLDLDSDSGLRWMGGVVVLWSVLTCATYSVWVRRRRRRRDRSGGRR
jgi:drug/metabolite transporter (DMT)-like permease